MSTADDTTARHPARIVVVGAGLAGSRTVLELRQQGYQGWVGLVGAESVPPYDRPPLSKHLLDRPNPAWLSDELDADALNAADQVWLGTTATGLQVTTEGIHLTAAPADGTTAAPHTASLIAADAIVIATGSTAVSPWPASRVLHTAADADQLRSALSTARHLVIVGAGWIGAEVATVVAGAGIEVTALEARCAPLPVLGAAGDLTRPWWQTAGVRLRTGVRVSAVDDDSVRLSTGERIEADVVLTAIGARPATAWLDGVLPRDPAGLVPVDRRWMPLGEDRALSRVRVVGDVARRRSTRHGWVNGGHWDAALRGPAVAVSSLLGGDTVDDPAPYVFSTQFGHELALYGAPGPGEDLVLRGDPAHDDQWTALWFTPESEQLTAVFTVDRPRDVAAARRLFTDNQLPRLDRSRAGDPSIPLRSARRD